MAHRVGLSLQTSCTRLVNNPPAPFSNHMRERLQQATQCVGNRLALRDQLHAGNQQQAQRLRIHALDCNLAELAGSHHLRQAMPVVGIGLVDLHA